MSGNYTEYLSKSLKYFSKMLTPEDIKELEPGADLPLASLKSVKANTQVIAEGDNADTILIALSGSFECVAASVYGENIIIDTMPAPYYFGLLEMILNIDRYAASVRSSTEAIYIEIPSEIFAAAMKNDISIANNCTVYFANVAYYYMDMAEVRALYSTDDAILMYLFYYCDKSVMPYRLTISRKTMSHLLHVNLRSLYRHLGRLKEENFFTISDGKITINKEQYKKLEAYCEGLSDLKRYPLTMSRSLFRNLYAKQ